LIHRIRERHAFERLARDGTRIRQADLWCTWCPDPDSNATCVAFTIGRAFGPATQRNRLRRRLRAALYEIDRRHPLPPGLMLIGGRSSASEHTFAQLNASLTRMVEQMRRTPVPNS
jgi:ribonuclease P protein component